MKISRSFQIQLVLFAIAMAYSLLMAGKMPDIVPIHWDSAGHVNGYGSKWVNLLVMPGMVGLMALLTVLLPKLSPEKFKIEPFENTYSLVMIMMGVLMLVMHVVIVQTTVGAKWDITKVMMGVLFASFIFVGNLMGKIQQNFYMGVRTPWTLADERVWHGTHRFAAKVFVFGSLVGLALVVLNVPFWFSFTLFMFMCFSPVVQSYLLYKRIHGNGKVTSS